MIPIAPNEKAKSFSWLGLLFEAVFVRQIKERRADALRSVPSHKGCYAWEGFNQKRLIGKAKLNWVGRRSLACASGVGCISSNSIGAGRKASGAGSCCHSTRPAIRSLANLPAIFIEIDADRDASRATPRRPSIIVGTRGIRQAASNTRHCSRLNHISISIYREAILEHQLGRRRGDCPQRHHHQADDTQQQRKKLSLHFTFPSKIVLRGYLPYNKTIQRKKK